MILRLSQASNIRDLSSALERARTTNIYRKAYEDIKAELERLKRSGASETTIEAFRQLERQAAKAYSEVAPKVDKNVRESMRTTSEGVTQSFSSYMQQYGLPRGTYMINIPTSVVHSIANGLLYQHRDNLGDLSKNWGLSKAIWGHKDKTLKDIHEIIARGVAAGKSTYDIAKDLESFVDPLAKQSWDWSKVYPNSRKTIDYNAQRLARTCINHAYQQTFKQMGQYNPWISYYVWRSAFEHGRTCPVCMDMDGNRYSKDGKDDLPEMPLDHPNGLCYFEYEIDTDKMTQQLAEWGNSPDGTFPEIDRYMQYLKER